MNPRKPLICVIDAFACPFFGNAGLLI